MIYAKKSYYLILLVLRWIILYLILENDLLFSRNQVFCFKKWKLVEALIQVEFIIFLWNFAHVFSSQCLQNYFLLCFAVLTKNQKTFFFLNHVETRSFYFSLDISRVRKIQSPYALADISKENKCANFQRKVNSTWVIVSKSCFFKQKTLFLENKLSKLRYKIRR